VTRAPRRWEGATAATLGLLALGLLFASPPLLLFALVPLGFVAYGSLSAVPATATVDCVRRFYPEEPTPGDAVTVTLTVRNTGEAVLPDLRVVDGVPSGLAVRDGSPRLATALAPGERASCTYEVVARRGTHAFTDPTVRLRSLAGSDVRTAQIPVGDGRDLRTVDPIDTPSDRDTRAPQAGRQPTSRGGGGVEFHATREYRPGDPADRIDWRRYAKSGDLATVEYRAGRGLRTVLVLDGRPPGRVVPGPGEPTVAERSASAAASVREAVAGGTGTVELLALGVDACDVDVALPSGDPPRATDRAGATALLRAVVEAAEVRGDPAEDAGVGSAGGGTPPATDADVERLVGGLHPTAQVVLFSPLLDDRATALARRIAAGGHPLVVVSPGPEPGRQPVESPGATVAALERAARIDAIEPHGSVVDWGPDEGLTRAIGRTLDRLRRTGP